MRQSLKGKYSNSRAAGQGPALGPGSAAWWYSHPKCSPRDTRRSARSPGCVPALYKLVIYWDLNFDDQEQVLHQKQNRTKNLRMLLKSVIVKGSGRDLMPVQRHLNTFKRIDMNNISTSLSLKWIFARFAYLFIVKSICILSGIYFIVWHMVPFSRRY